MSSDELVQEVTLPAIQQLQSNLLALSAQVAGLSEKVATLIDHFNSHVTQQHQAQSRTVQNDITSNQEFNSLLQRFETLERDFNEFRRDFQDEESVWEEDHLPIPIDQVFSSEDDFPEDCRQHLMGILNVHFRETITTPGFHPTENQVQNSFHALNHLFPPEISAKILHYIDYWPRKCWVKFGNNVIRGPWGGTSDLTHLSTDDSMASLHNVRKIRVVTIAHDQGWAGDTHSWTWGEVHFHFDRINDEGHDSQRDEFYRNQTADSRWQIHERVIL